MKKLLLVFLVCIMSSSVWASSYIVNLVSLSSQRIVSIRATVPEAYFDTHLADVFVRTQTHINNYGHLAGAPFVRTFDAPIGYIDYRAGFHVASNFPSYSSGSVTVGYLPSGIAAITTHVGPYLYLGQAYQAVENYMYLRGYYSTGAPWEVYLDDPEEVPEHMLRTQIVWPCTYIAP